MANRPPTWRASGEWAGDMANGADHTPALRIPTDRHTTAHSHIYQELRCSVRIDANDSAAAPSLLQSHDRPRP